ncbi:MAG: LLM class flavin-dependent oxidoreductase [Nocardioidaceae bacterium]|nr:LLM class flavin-dependent oxidoreductase [Nocardioidaceae bacterium]
MRYGLSLPIFGPLADPSTAARLAAEAENAGWDGVFCWDHVAYGPDVGDIADPWVTMAAMACATERVRLGPMVTPLPRRRPITLARQVASLDHLSAGRLTLGVGIGGDGAGELSGTGEELDARVRGAMLDESLALLAQAWSGETVRHRGPHYVLDGLQVRPVPVQHPGPPIWVALRRGNRAPLRRAARHDGMFPIEVDTPDQLAELVAQAHAMRSPDAGQFDVAVGGRHGDHTRDPAAYADAGATWWITSFSPYDVTVGDVRDALTRLPT